MGSKIGETKKVFLALRDHPWYGQLVSKLGSKDLQSIITFIEETELDDRSLFFAKLNKRPSRFEGKNQLVIEEILLVVFNTSSKAVMTPSGE